MPLVNENNFLLDRIRSDLDNAGYSIVKDLVKTGAFADIQRFWMVFYTKQRAQSLSPVAWSPYLGEGNFVGYTDNRFNKLFRTYDFLWNPPYHSASRELGLELNALRNQVTGDPVTHGIAYSPDGYGIFNTTSFYPAKGGWMKMHADGVIPNHPLIHFIVPLTFKGTHYTDGGMVVTDKRGAKNNVDDLLSPGDVIFYDGRQEHGVEKLTPIQNASNIGRIQLFVIPTVFKSIEDNDEAYRHLSVSRFINGKRRILIDAIRKIVKKRSSYRS